MSMRPITREGEVWITLRDAATWFGLELVELEEWVEAELVEPPRALEGEQAVPASQLDRIALLVQYTRVLGLDATAIRLLLVP